MDQALKETVEAWIAGDVDPLTQQELSSLLQRGDAEAEQALRERFAGPLEFGTAGLRGVLGAGETRLNRAVVLRTSWGLAQALGKLVDGAKQRGVVVGFDGRHQSDVFARDTANVLRAAGFRVFLYESVEPTPLVAFAVKHLGAAAGVMVTASHNPPEYNGYKVYWANGAQIVEPTDLAIAAAIAEAPAAKDVPADPEAASDAGELRMLGRPLEEEYLQGALNLSISRAGARDLCIVHTALHGVGSRLALELLARAGFSRVVPVVEQAEPDGAFPTVSFPNPEERGAMDLAYRTARAVRADLVLANDPDADRLSVAIPAGDGYRQLSGNEVGVLLGHYVLTRGPKRQSAVLASLVSSPMLGVVAEALGVHYEETLTGFKWIANRAMALEAERGLQFEFGYEEALGYTIGGLVRDKDGVSAALLFAEMTAVLRAEGHDVQHALDELARSYGVFVSDQLNFVRPGVAGRAELAALMSGLRETPPTAIADVAVDSVHDLASGIQRFADGRSESPPMPSANVLTFRLVDGTRIIARPSGTEPKVKVYFDVRGDVAGGETVVDARARAVLRCEAYKDAVQSLLQG